MALRNSNNYLVAIAIEDTYNTQQTIIDSDALTIPDKLDWNFAPITAEFTKKENSLYKAADRTKITGNLTNATLSGDFTDGHSLLLALYFDDTDSPYLYPSSIPDTTLSASIYQLYLNSAGAVVTYDVLPGAVIKDLSITGEANGIIQYSATIDAAEYRQEVANTGDDELTISSPQEAGTPFLFGDVVASSWDSKTVINSFNLSLSKTYVDNVLRFQNSLTKTNDRYIGVGGTLSISQLWDTDDNDTDQAYRYNESAITATITLATAAYEWEIGIEGVITEATRPDADRGLFVGNYTFDLTSGGGTYELPVQITVTAL